MKPAPRITALFLDLGGVLLTNGWDRAARSRAAQTFGLDEADLSERHHLTFDTYEEGKLDLQEYLARTVFYEPRPFSREQFTAFMFAQSQPHPEMIDLVCKLKERHHLKLAVISNEGRELAEYRINTFELGRFIDFFIVSSFVHFRKPDVDMYRLALDVAQVPAAAVAYLDDRPMFVQVAGSVGLHGIRHENDEATRAALAALGLE